MSKALARRAAGKPAAPKPKAFPSSAILARGFNADRDPVYKNKSSVQSYIRNVLGDNPGLSIQNPYCQLQVWLPRIFELYGFVRFIPKEPLPASWAPFLRHKECFRYSEGTIITVAQCCAEDATGFLFS